MTIYNINYYETILDSLSSELVNSSASVSISIFFLLPTLLFVIGVLGVLLNKKNLVFLLLSLELMLLSSTVNFLFISVFFSNPVGQLFALVVLTVAAAESAIGLGILVVIFRVKQTIDFNSLNFLRG